jgi:hypothetical protein
VPSRPEDPSVKVSFADNHIVLTPGGGGTGEIVDGTIYLTMSLRNAGSGIAVLHGWRFEPAEDLGAWVRTGEWSGSGRCGGGLGHDVGSCSVPVGVGVGEVRRVRARLGLCGRDCGCLARVGQLAEVVAERVEGPFALRSCQPA